MAENQFRDEDLFSGMAHHWYTESIIPNGDSNPALSDVLDRDINGRHLLVALPVIRRIDQDFIKYLVHIYQ
jgi:hypothetical protein